MNDNANISNNIQTAIKQVENSVKNKTVLEWLSSKKEFLFSRGFIYKHHIVDTTSYEWNALKDRDANYITPEECNISKECIDILGIKYIISGFNIYWLIRFNA